MKTGERQGNFWVELGGGKHDGINGIFGEREGREFFWMGLI
jgi:hypothetical protein